MQANARNRRNGTESEQIVEELGLTDVDVEIDVDRFEEGVQIFLFFDPSSVTLSGDILSQICFNGSDYQIELNWESHCIVLESLDEKKLVTDGGVTVEGQTDLWTYGQEASKRSEDWLPRTGDCDCGGNEGSCFRCIDWAKLESRNDEVLGR